MYMSIPPSAAGRLQTAGCVGCSVVVQGDVESWDAGGKRVAWEWCVATQHLRS
jgi:hypothetical protein